ncbi:hypothetical protein SUGI_0638080 [Cryptomeria japonica]|nr:hypothetical protein SUGI_0638080 [Cryptomeria japonica]
MAKKNWSKNIFSSRKNVGILLYIRWEALYSYFKFSHSIEPKTREQPRKRLLGKTKVAESTPPTKGSILCNNCDGNGMVQCSQCDGNGVNSIDHFNGRFKAGEICWLCSSLELSKSSFS